MYLAREQVNTIGFESTWTVIYIPPIHPNQTNSLNPSFSSTTSTNAPYGRKYLSQGMIPMSGDELFSRHDTASHKKDPISIHSILSPVILHPRNLIRSLSHFVLLAATSFSLVQSHANVNQLTHFRHARLWKRKAVTNSFNYPALLRLIILAVPLLRPQRSGSTRNRGGNFLSIRPCSHDRAHG